MFTFSNKFKRILISYYICFNIQQVLRGCNIFKKKSQKQADGYLHSYSCITPQNCIFLKLEQGRHFYGCQTVVFWDCLEEHLSLHSLIQEGSIETIKYMLLFEINCWKDNRCINSDLHKRCCRIKASLTVGADLDLDEQGVPAYCN